MEWWFGWHTHTPHTHTHTHTHTHHQTVHERDELSGRVQECEEELSMALKELQREQASVKIITMQNNEVREYFGV